MVRRWLVLGMLAWVSVGSAQHGDNLFRDTEAGQAFYAFLEEHGVQVYEAAKSWSMDGDRELAAELLGALHEALRRNAAAGGDESAAPDGVCGFVAGTGGTARLDGGGELVPFSTAGGFVPEDVIEQAWFSWQLADVFEGAAFPADIAIVDEFLFDRIEAWFDGRSTVGLELVREGDVLEAGRSNMAPGSLEVTHGHIVLHHLLAIVMHHGFEIVAVDVTRPEGPALLTLYTSGQGEMRIHLFGIDFDGLQGLGDALDGVALVDDPVAVVMSWGITGCRLAAVYADDRPLEAGRPFFETLVEFTFDVLHALARAESEGGGDSIVIDACNAVQDALGDCNEPEFRSFVATIVALVEFERQAREQMFGTDAERRDVSHVGFFASAGNERLPFAMPPASFDGVVAVAACSPTSSPDRAWFSNRGDHVADDEGEVVAIGAWFAAPDLDAAPTGLGYWGTSFAAPLAALSAHPRAPAEAGGTWHVPGRDRLCSPFRQH